MRRLLPVLLAVLLLWAPPAFGHAAFVGSDPAPGQRVESSPARVTLVFTEPLNRRLAGATLRPAAGGPAIPTELRSSGSKRLVVVPKRRLGRGAYRARVAHGRHPRRAPARGLVLVRRARARGGRAGPRDRPAGPRRLGADPRPRRALRRRPAARGGAAAAAAGEGPARLAGAGDRRVRHEAAARARRARSPATSRGWPRAPRSWRWSTEAADAAGGVSASGLSDFLLANVAGVARVALVALLAACALVRARAPRLATALAVLALGAIAASGHAGSADPRVPSILNDWLHLVAVRGVAGRDRVARAAVVAAAARRRTRRAARGGARGAGAVRAASRRARSRSSPRPGSSAWSPSSAACRRCGTRTSAGCWR